MTAETDLLPCPFCGLDVTDDEGCFPLNREGTRWEVRCGNPSCFAHDPCDESMQAAVARWNRRATAARDAEIKALRAEVDEWKSVASAQAELHDEAERCAEELAKALAELITWIPSADTYRRLGFDPAAPMRALEKARAALGRGGLSND